MDNSHNAELFFSARADLFLKSRVRIQINPSSGEIRISCLCSGSYNDEDVYLFSTNQSGDTDFTQQYRGHRNNATVKENMCITHTYGQDEIMI